MRSLLLVFLAAAISSCLAVDTITYKYNGFKNKFSLSNDHHGVRK